MNKMVINGLCSQTFICSNLPRIERFYTAYLGLSVVKRTVHHHDPRLPVLVFGFLGEDRAFLRHQTIVYVEWNPIFYMIPESGFIEPSETSAGVGSPRVGDPKGRWGAGTNHHLALHVPNREGLLKWKRRLSDIGVHVTGPYNRNYFHAIYFRDPDGAIIEIATTEPGFGHDEAVLGSGFRHQPEENLVGARDEIDIALETWPDPVPEISADIRLQGFHHITSISSNAERTQRFFVDTIGLRLIKKTEYLDEKGGTHFYYGCDDDLSPGSVLTFFGLPDYSPGRLGTGLSHHFSLVVENEAALADEHARLSRLGVTVSSIQETPYSQIFYFRDPDGHICTLSTPENLLADEDLESLGTKLQLSEPLEPKRAEIEQSITLRPAPAPTTRLSL